jgi:hypothetical protein
LNSLKFCLLFLPCRSNTCIGFISMEPLKSFDFTFPLGLQNLNFYILFFCKDGMKSCFDSLLRFMFNVVSRWGLICVSLI